MTAWMNSLIPTNNGKYLRSNNRAFATGLFLAIFGSVYELLPLYSGKLVMAATVNRLELAMDISKLDCNSLKRWISATDDTTSTV